jgi:hypothetical protein
MRQPRACADGSQGIARGANQHCLATKMRGAARKSRKRGRDVGGMADLRDADDRGPTPGASRRTGSPGYQTGSEDPPSSEEVPGSGSSEDDEPMDPYLAFAEAEARRRSEKAKRDPAIWLPGPDDLDRDSLADRETRFSADSYGGRGNPQVGVRLRPLDFERLRKAADLYGVRPTTLARMMVIRGINAILDAELSRDGEFLRARSR